MFCTRFDTSITGMPVPGLVSGRTLTRTSAAIVRTIFFLWCFLSAFYSRPSCMGVIILAVIAHQLPKMVAGMVTGGGGYGGHVGGMGVMTMLSAALAGSSIARAMAAGGADSAAAGTAMDDSYQTLMDRIAVLEGANAAGGVDSAMSAGRNNWTGQGGMESAGESSSAQGARWSGPARESAGLAWLGDPKNVSGGGKASSKAKAQLSGTTAQSTEPPEPPLDHPISPDEQRGFPRPPEWQDESGKEEP